MASEQETIPAVKSKSLWGNLFNYIGFATEVVQAVGDSGVVPPHTGLVLILISNILQTIGRLNPEIKPIEGVITQQE